MAIKTLEKIIYDFRNHIDACKESTEIDFWENFYEGAFYSLKLDGYCENQIESYRTQCNEIVFLKKLALKREYLKNRRTI